MKKKSKTKQTKNKKTQMKISFDVNSYGIVDI